MNNTQWDDAVDQYPDVAAQRLILRPSIKRLLATNNPTSVLDVGCGTGVDLYNFYLEGIRTVGIDESSESIRIAKSERPGPTYLNKSFQEYTPEDPFDLVIANVFFPNVKDENQLREFFEFIKKNLSEGGKLFATNVHPNYQRTCQTDFYRQRYPEGKIEEGIEFILDLLDPNTKCAFDELSGLVNYHWSPRKLEEIARKSGLTSFEQHDILHSQEEYRERIGSGNPKYVMFEITH